MSIAAGIFLQQTERSLNSRYTKDINGTASFTFEKDLGIVLFVYSISKFSN